VDYLNIVSRRYTGVTIFVSVGYVTRKIRTAISTILTILTLFTMSSCDLILDAAIRAAGGSSKEIVEFKFTAALNSGTGVTSDCVGVIDGTNIAIMVPDNTNMKALVATFSTTGASVKVGSTIQVSGVTPNDFTTPTIYVVTAADSTTKSFSVSVTSKELTSFRFLAARNTAAGLKEDCIGVIQGTNIALTVPFGVSVSSLVATFETTGVEVRVGSVVQVSGVTANDFTNPVTYVVTGADSATKSYTVTVTVNLWHVVGTPGFSTRPVYEVLLAIDPSDTLYCLYVDDSTIGNGKLMKYADGSWQIVGTISGPVYHVSMAIDALGTVYISYRDNSFYARVRVRKYASGSWYGVGNVLSEGDAASTSVAIDPAGAPYVAFEDSHEDDHYPRTATVKKYDGANWQLLGAAGLGAGDTENTSLAIDSAGIPYVAFKDHSHDYKSTVMRYVSGSWQVVGTAGFSSGSALDLSLAIDSADNLYVLYSDASNAKRDTVMKYVSGSWQVVGTAGFTASQARSPSMAIDSTNIPYVAFAPDLGRVSVMKYESGSWQLVGFPNFSEGSAGDPSIAIDTSGNIYVAYRDDAHSGKVTVMRFN